MTAASPDVPVPSSVAPATGKLGVLTPGLGAVATTFIGVSAASSSAQTTGPENHRQWIKLQRSIRRCEDIKLRVVIRHDDPVAAFRQRHSGQQGRVGEREGNAAVGVDPAQQADGG